MLVTDNTTGTPFDLDDPKMLSAVLSTANDAIIITEAEPIDGPHPRIVYANESYVRMTGYSLDEILGKTPRLTQGPETDRPTLDRIRARLTAWEPFREEVLNYRKDGTPFWVELNVRPLANEAGWYTHWVSVQRDVTERRAAMDTLAEHARDLEEAQKLAKLGTWRWEVGNGHLSFSSEVVLMVGGKGDSNTISIAAIQNSIDEEGLQNARSAFDRIALLGETVSFEFQVLRGGLPFRTIWAEGQPERGKNDEIVAVRGLCQDVTERRSIERRLIWNGTHDILTGLLNLDGLRTQASSLIARARASGRPVVVGLADIDHLKLVNDTLGHAVGDALIIEASRRLATTLGPDACLARLGGDEFVFIDSGRRLLDQLPSQMEDLAAFLKTPFDYQGRQLDCAASIGIAVASAPALCLDTLLRNADLAMYRAKEIGRGGFAFYSADLQEGVDRRVAHLDLARLAVGSKLVVPHFQPKVSLSTGQVVGYEALLRLQIGEQILPPSALEHAFENVELAMRLGDEMLRRVLDQVRRWRMDGVAFGSVAINVSAAELLRNGYAEKVLASLRRAEVPASCIEIEVTEGVLVGRGADRVAEALRQLRGAGIGIALDDFGTGYASLTHLKSLPITAIKIDRSFVAEMIENSHDAAIVRAVISLAKALSLEVVAEGVETEAQAKVLRNWGCPVVQGFLFGRPKAADDHCSHKIGLLEAG
ncbi:EAL domain-containing protein [Microcoleus sp. Pol14D5]